MDTQETGFQKSRNRPPPHAVHRPPYRVSGQWTPRGVHGGQDEWTVWWTRWTERGLRHAPEPREIFCTLTTFKLAGFPFVAPCGGMFWSVYLIYYQKSVFQNRLVYNSFFV